MHDCAHGLLVAIGCKSADYLSVFLKDRHGTPVLLFPNYSKGNNSSSHYYLIRHDQLWEGRS